MARAQTGSLPDTSLVMAKQSYEAGTNSGNADTPKLKAAAN